MDPVTISLIVTLIGVAKTLTPEILDLINQFKSGSSDITPEQIATIDAALQAKREELAKVYAENGVK